MDSAVDRSRPFMVMQRLPLARQIALKSFLKRWNHNGWMQLQDGWRQKASLIAS
jgi:hypothetical protein